MAEPWQPGRPVVTAEDRAAWRRWKQERTLYLQRQRRASLRRIDYYPSEDAAKIIDGLIRPIVGGDYSSVINRIVTEWQALGSNSDCSKATNPLKRSAKRALLQRRALAGEHQHPTDGRPERVWIARELRKKRNKRNKRKKGCPRDPYFA